MELYISVVIPVFNSRNTLQQLYSRITGVLAEMTEDFEIILVDDGSRDGSYEGMKNLHKQDDRVKSIQLYGNFGQQNAIMCGFHHACGKYVVTMDDDLQNPPEEIKKLVEKLGEGYDVVYGIPIEKSHSILRNIGSKLTDRMFNIICGKPESVRVSSFRAMTRSIVEEVIKDKTSFVYISAILLKHKARIGNVYVRHDTRVDGKSNYSLYKLMKLFMKLFLYYSPVSVLSGKSSLPQFIIKDKEL